MLNGLDLFSGIGGLSLALGEWVGPIAYCDNDPYAQAVLLSRMQEGELCRAPIWDDVRTLRIEHLQGIQIDIVYGGFPCQDLSVAGTGGGLDGERSGLFFHIIRLCREIRPRFIFMENVPALSVRGLDRVLLELYALGYDARWTIVSAAEMGAPHLRERIWILAHANGDRLREQQSRRERGEVGEQVQLRSDGKAWSLADSNRVWKSPGPEGWDVARDRSIDGSKNVAYTDGKRCERSARTELEAAEFISSRKELANTNFEHGHYVRHGASEILRIERGSPVVQECRWWESEPDVGRVAHGVPARVDRLTGLGNAVVPQVAREAFQRLMGLI